MKKLLALLISSITLCGLAQSTNTNYLYSTNLVLTITRTNVPFQLSQYPSLSGISNVLGAGVAIFGSFQARSNYWDNAGYVDFSTNSSYGFTIDNISGDINITGFKYLGAFSTNDPYANIWFTNHDTVAHTVTVPASCRTTTGARVNYVTNAQVSQYEFHFGYSMTNLIIRNFW